MSFLFLFKQKTAYEMRISDWSSDVCSSDLSNSAWLSFHHCGAQCLIDTGLPARAGRPKPGQQILVEPDCDPFLVASLGTANTPGAPCFALREGLFDRGVADIEIFRVIRISRESDRKLFVRHRCSSLRL